MTKTRSIISETIIGKDEPLQPFRSAVTQDTEDVVADGLDVQQVFALEAADELEQLGKRAQGMLSAIPAIVAEERIEQHNLVYECEAKRWFRLAKGVRACAEAVADSQSLSDRIDVLIEAAYREGHCDGRFFVTSGEFSTEEIAWQKSESRAALHQEGIARPVDGSNRAAKSPVR